jgi:hypothetical protein
MIYDLWLFRIRRADPQGLRTALAQSMEARAGIAKIPGARTSVRNAKAD